LLFSFVFGAGFGNADVGAGTGAGTGAGAGAVACSCKYKSFISPPGKLTNGNIVDSLDGTTATLSLGTLSSVPKHLTSRRTIDDSSAFILNKTPSYRIS
jgi:hypothetical protein